MPTFFESFYYDRMLNFVKRFFCTYEDYHMIFIPQCVNSCCSVANSLSDSHQASLIVREIVKLSLTISQSFPKLMSIELVMP